MWPMRINKYLAHKGYSTRRAADGLVAEGKVLINGVPAVLGSKVDEHDTVEVHGARQKDSCVYLAYHKTKGTVTHGAQGNEREIADHIHKLDNSLDVFPVGRLDKNSTGLILLTDDGRIVEPLLSPDKPHEKEYKVTVNERLRSDFVEQMSNGVDIGGYVTKPCVVKRLDKHTFRITLTEGKNHQIKRMTNALGYTVNTLHRTRIMNIRLGQLRPNTFRHIKGAELETLLEKLCIDTQ